MGLSPWGDGSMGTGATLEHGDGIEVMGVLGQRMGRMGIRVCGLAHEFQYFLLINFQKKSGLWVLFYCFQMIMFDCFLGEMIIFLVVHFLTDFVLLHNFMITIRFFVNKMMPHFVWLPHSQESVLNDSCKNRFLREIIETWNIWICYYNRIITTKHVIFHFLC